MIYVFLADGFEDIEAIAVVDILKRANCNVKTVGIGKNDITSVNGLKVYTDMKDSELNLDDISGIVLPGGMPGAENLRRSNIVCESLKYCEKNKKLISAICAAPFILGELGLLKGKQATCYPGFEDKLIGANVVPDSVCIDGNIITAKGPGVTFEFAFKIIEYLSGRELARSIGDSMQCVLKI